MNRSRFAIGLLAVTVALGAIALWLDPHGAPPIPAAPPPAAMAADPAADDHSLQMIGPDEGVRPPAFDIVRIEPTGMGAASGTAEPHAKILLKSGEITVARAEADERGEWTLMLTAPLPRGDQLLSLDAVLPDGRGISSRESLIVSLPERAEARPLVVLRAPDVASEVMQTPGGPIARALTLDAVDEAEDGSVMVGGRAEPGAKLNLYLDNGFVGETICDDEGRWSLKADRKPQVGVIHRLRVDALAEDEAGAKRVATRIELPLERAKPAKVGPHPRPVEVEIRQNSWRIEGGGILTSTVIYDANAGRMLDPSIAYPGQVTEAPADATAMPAASER